MKCYKFTFRKTGNQGYKLVVMAIVVYSNNNLCTAFLLLNWMIADCAICFEGALV